jgi:hypothetical protein
MQNFLDECDAVFMCLPTPEIGETGESDLTFYTTAIENLAQALLLRNNGAQEKYVLVINKSTVPIGTAERALSMLQEKGVKNIGVASNPEFLVGGKAVEGAMKPDRIVVGAKQKKDLEIMRDIYQRFYDNPEVKYIEVETAEAEAGKLLANFYLFQKLAICFDVIGRTCEAFEGERLEGGQILEEIQLAGDGYSVSFNNIGREVPVSLQTTTSEYVINGKSVRVLEEPMSGGHLLLAMSVCGISLEIIIPEHGRDVANKIMSSVVCSEDGTQN